MPQLRTESATLQIRTLDFFDYKSFPRFTISARSKNVLVGANNAGKSTSLDALRIAADVLRYARRRTAAYKSHGDHGVCSTYSVPQTIIQTDMRYCVHNFSDATARIELVADNGNRFVIKLRPDDDVEAYLVSEVPAQKRAQFLRDQFPIEISVVPTLSPLEQNEELVQQETVERNRYGRLASRNFRNFWLHKTSEEFEAFADLVELGWPGIRVRRPEIEVGDKRIVRMYFRDGPRVRKVQWAGFGFQVWMQTMMHLMQSDQKSILVLDEPDIYLHPDLQHRLLRLVSERVGQFFIATHSTEIINSADPGDVLIVRPNARSAKRIRSDDNYHEVYSAIGSSENAQFARLARTRKVLYFEGHDAKLLSKLSKSVGGLDYLAGSSVTLMRTDGFSNWGRVSTTSWVFKNFFEIDVQVAGLFDRDFRSDAEVEEFEQTMAQKGALCFVLPFKELENILLSKRAIKRVILKYIGTETADEKLSIVDSEIDRLVNETKDEVFGQRMGHHIQYQLRKAPNVDTPTISTKFQREFSALWKDPGYRLCAAPGKKVFTDIARYVQDNFGVTLTPPRVAEELSSVDIHPRFLEITATLRDYFGAAE